MVVVTARAARTAKACPCAPRTARWRAADRNDQGNGATEQDHY
jgi:hypothetical protein